VIAQRLARKICTNCAKEIDVKSDERRWHAKKTFMNFDKELLKKEIISRGINKDQWSKFMVEWKIIKWTWEVDGNKCPVCGGSWYKWRLGMFEIMDYSDDIKNMLMEWKSNMEIEQYALKHGMIDLERDGIFKVIKWMTDLDEIYRYVKTKYN
jgi:type IV pilus assembly protein PilB